MNPFTVFFIGEIILKQEVWSFENHPEISISVEMALSWWARFKGLMLRAPLPSGKGLFLRSTNSIHMCFMRFAIDAVYFDSSMTIVKIVPRLRPWIGLSACLKASSVLEMKAGEAARLGLAIGMRKL